MKKVFLLTLFFQLSLVAFSQLNGDGFYFVQNYGSKRWAYLRDNYGKLDIGSQQADCGAIQLWKNQPLNDDPSAVIYIYHSGDGRYDLQGQGTGLYKLINYCVQVMDRSKYTKVNNTYWVYASSNGVTKYLDDEEISTLCDDGACGFNTTGNYRLWSVFKVDEGEHYLGVRPTVSVNGEHYAPYYVSFAFTRTPGMKVYYVSKVDAGRGLAVLSEYTGDIVPASTPVLIKCTSESSSSNKIMPLISGISKPSNNALKGVYFNNPKRLRVTADAAKEYDSSTMRVLGVTRDGKVGFVNSTSSLTAYKNVYYLNANQAYLSVPAGTPDELSLISEAEYEAMTAYCQISVSASANGSVAISPVSDKYKVGTTVTVTATPNEGCSFTGWSNGEKANPYTFTVSTDVNLTASFVVNKYTITFDTDGGSDVSAITQEYGSTVTAPSNPTKTGYTFAGWDQTIPSTMPASNMTVKAKWTINQYTITFDTDGGTAVPSIKQDYGTAITAPATPEKTGYTFMGWSEDIPATMPARDMTVKAKWQINQYSVTFVVGDRVISEKRQDYGSVIEAPADPSLEGYTFCGWDPVFVAGTTVPVGGVTYTAQFKINSYKIVYLVDGVTYATEEYNYGEDIVPLANPEKEGYTFSGWSYVPGTMTAEDITVTGSFKVNVYKVSYYYNGALLYEVEVPYGSAIPTYEWKPEQESVQFYGWVSDQQYETMPAHDVVYTADCTNGINSIKSSGSLSVYTIGGVYITTVSDIREAKLSTGIYIVNGKKYVVK